MFIKKQVKKKLFSENYFEVFSVKSITQKCKKMHMFFDSSQVRHM